MIGIKNPILVLVLFKIKRWLGDKNLPFVKSQKQNKVKKRKRTTRDNFLVNADEEKILDCSRSPSLYAFETLGAFLFFFLFLQCLVLGLIMFQLIHLKIKLDVAPAASKEESHGRKIVVIRRGGGHGGGGHGGGGRGGSESGHESTGQGSAAAGALPIYGAGSINHQNYNHHHRHNGSNACSTYYSGITKFLFPLLALSLSFLFSISIQSQGYVVERYISRTWMCCIWLEHTSQGQMFLMGNIYKYLCQGQGYLYVPYQLVCRQGTRQLNSTLRTASFCLE